MCIITTPSFQKGVPFLAYQALCFLRGGAHTLSFTNYFRFPVVMRMCVNLDTWATQNVTEANAKRMLTDST